MKYRIETYKAENGADRIRIVFEDKKYKLLSTFLQSDVSSFEKWIKSDFDRVISGEDEYGEVNGNVCFVEITSLTTKIYNNLLEDEAYYASCCEVETKKLKKLIDEWCDKVKEFKETYQKK